MDFTRPDPRYDAENCLYYTGWNQGGLVSLELTNPQYNPCMSRSANVSGKVATAQGDLTVALKAGRDSKGPSVSLSIEGLGNKVQLGAVTRLGSAIDADGAQVTATSNSVQIDREAAAILLARLVLQHLRELLHVDAPAVGRAVEAAHREDRSGKGRCARG